MRRAWLYLVFALIVPVALLVSSTGGAAQPAVTEGTPTAIGSGGAVATVDTLASAGRRRGAARRRQRGRRRGRGGGRPRRHRAVLVRHRRRRLHGHPDERRRGHDDRRPRDGAGRDAAELLLRERRAAAVQRRALQRPVGRRAGHGRDVGRGARALRHDVARGGAAAGDRGRPRRLRRRPDVLRPDAGERRLLRRRSLDRARSTSTPTARRATSARCFRNPDLARAYAADRAPRARRASTAARSRTRSSSTVQHPPSRRTANHVWRPGLMTMRDLTDYTAPEREPTHVGYRGLDVYGMGPPSSGGSTVGEALNILEGFDSRRIRSRAGAAPLPRGVALLVRRPQRLPGRSRLLRRAAHAACSPTGSRPSAGR